MSARRQAFPCSLNGMKLPVTQTSFTALSVRRKELKGGGEQGYNIKRRERKCNPIIVVRVILLKHRIIANVNKVLSPNLLPQS